MAVTGSNAVRTRVATANNNDVFTFGPNLIFDFVAGIDLVLAGQKLHSKMHAIEISTWYGQISRLLGATRQNHGIKLFLQLRGAHGLFGPIGHFGIFRQVANHDTATKNNPFSLHLLNPAVNMDFFHLEIGNTVTQQAADAVIFFKQCHVMASARQLLGCSHTCWAGAYDSDFFPGFMLGQLGLDPAFSPSAINDGMLN